MSWVTTASTRKWMPTPKAPSSGPTSARPASVYGSGQGMSFHFSFSDIAMKKVHITAVRQTVYPDLMARYENPIEHTCDIHEGETWVSVEGQCPLGLCPSAWDSMRPFVEALARGEGNFYDGWMQNPFSAMISCNDGFRPVSFYIEVTDD